MSLDDVTLDMAERRNRLRALADVSHCSLSSPRHPLTCKKITSVTVLVASARVRPWHGVVALERASILKTPSPAPQADVTSITDVYKMGEELGRCESCVTHAWVVCS